MIYNTSYEELKDKRRSTNFVDRIVETGQKKKRLIWCWHDRVGGKLKLLELKDEEHLATDTEIHSGCLYS